jgi:hypothetical protein
LDFKDLVNNIELMGKYKKEFEEFLKQRRGKR